MTRPDHRAAIEALELHKASIVSAVPINVKEHVDLLFESAKGNTPWGITTKPDGSIGVDPRILKPTFYTGRLRWFEKTMQWNGGSEAEYTEKTLQQEVFILVDGTWMVEWYDISMVGSVETLDGNPPGYQAPQQNDE